MFATECRLWKFTLIILIFIAISLVVICGVLGKTARDHNTCPPSKTECDSCKVCLTPQEAQLEEFENRENHQKFKIKPLMFENLFLNIRNKNILVEELSEDDEGFTYDRNTKTLSKDGMFLVYDNSHIRSTNTLVEGLGKEWYISLETGKILTYPRNNQFFALSVSSNLAVDLVDNMYNSKNTTFEFEM